MIKELASEASDLKNYKLCILWDTWNPKICNRILRDLFIIDRLAKVNRTKLVVACDAELESYVKQFGITVTQDYTDCNMYRVYVQEGAYVPDEVSSRIPDGRNFDVISLNSQPWKTVPQTSIPDDPYGNMPEKQTWKRIPLTMPLDRTPPRGTPEPMFSPWM